MNRIARLRPSPAMGVALLALFLSLGGVSYGVATGFIDSREIKNNTIQTKDIRSGGVRTSDIRNNEIRGFDVRNSTIRSADVALNTLIGADIAESRLGKVPSAARADNATHADSATEASSVAGVTPVRIAYAAADGAGFTPILSAGGLILEASCALNGQLTIRARTTQNGSSIFSGAGPTPGGDSSFNTGDTQDVIALGEANNPGVTRLVGFRGSGGSTVTVQLYALGAPNSIPGSSTNDCGAWGTAFVS